MKDEIDTFLEEIGASSTPESVKENQKSLTTVKFGKLEIPVDDDDAIMAAGFSSALEDKERSDDLYDYYVSRIEMDKDRSDSVREGLSKAVELRTNTTANLIRLLDLKKKYSAKAAQGNSLVSLNLSPRETGIDIKNLTSEILNG